MGLDLGHLHRTLPSFGKEEPSVAPCLALTLYSDVPLLELATSMAQVLRLFIDRLPKGALRSCWGDGGVVKLTTRRINKDIKTLEAIPPHYEHLDLYYSTGENGPPASHAVSIVANNFENDEYGIQANLLRLEWPWDAAEGDQLEPFVALVAEIAALHPFCVGNVGFAFSFWKFDGKARDQVNAMLPRYWGFDPTHESCSDVMKECTPAAHWLNLLSPARYEELGGDAGLARACPGLEPRRLENGVMLRSALRPPVADVNAGLPDLGRLPELARFMKPTRFRVANFAGSEHRVDVGQWLERFDELESKTWDNR